MRSSIFIFTLTLPLMACGPIEPVSPFVEICETIAQERLKHPDSYEIVSASEKAGDGNITEVLISFNAWNDYKVPMPHNIACIFEGKSKLQSIKWSGRPIRQHELDEIRGKLSL